MTLAVTSITVAEASIVVGLITAFTALVSTVYAAKAHRQAKGANAAVNGNAPGTVRLYELVTRQGEDLHGVKEWVKSWESSPWRNGDEVALWVVQNEERWGEVRDMLREIKRHCPERTGRV